MLVPAFPHCCRFPTISKSWPPNWEGFLRPAHLRRRVAERKILYSQRWVSDWFGFGRLTWNIKQFGAWKTILLMEKILHQFGCPKTFFYPIKTSFRASEFVQEFFHQPYVLSISVPCTETVCCDTIIFD